MTGSLRSRALRLTLGAAALIASSMPAHAGDIAIEHAWSPTVASAARTRAVYMVIRNIGEAPRRIIGAKVDGFAMAHLHMSAVTDGVATMSRLDALDVPPRGSVAFAPGALHVMAMKPLSPPPPGAALSVTIEFANGELFTVEAEQKSMADGLKAMREHDHGS